MKPSLKGALLTIVLALLAGFGGVYLGQTILNPQPRTPSLHDVIHDELRLDAAQLRRIEALEADYATRRQALELEMRAANADLAVAIREEHGYGPRVTAAIERFHHAMGQLQTEMVRHVFAMRDVMTPEQRERFDGRIVTALTAEPG